MTGDAIDPVRESILIDGVTSFHGNHNAGDLGFGHDGVLSVSVGDGGGDDRIGTTACDPDNAVSQSLDTLQGEVLRITPAGGIPKGNPYVCDRISRVTWKGTGRRSRVFARGLGVGGPIAPQFGPYGGPTALSYATDTAG